MKRSGKFIRILLTVAIFVFVAYAFSVIWSPQNIKRLFENRGENASNYNNINELHNSERAPSPTITFESVHHIVARHVDPSKFPEKSKFIEDMDIVEAIEMVYERAREVRHEGDMFIYEYAAEMIIGTQGQQCIRLVTTGDGTVITMYPIFELQEGHKNAA